MELDIYRNKIKKDDVNKSPVIVTSDTDGNKSQNTTMQTFVKPMSKQDNESVINDFCKGTLK